MSENGTNTHPPGLPMVLEPGRPRPTLLRLSPKAAFLSQLIAERQRLEPQRGRRRAPVAAAVDAYSFQSGAAVPRMPAGYRRTVLA